MDDLDSVIEKVKSEIGQVQIKKAWKIYIDKGVKIQKLDLSWDYETVYITAEVKEGASKVKTVNIRLHIEDYYDMYSYRCECSPYSYKNCAHILAVLFEFKYNPKYMKMISEAIENERKRKEKLEFNRIMENFKNSISQSEPIVAEKNEKMPELSTNVNIIPVIKKNRYGEYELGFKIGEKRMYKLKSIEDFYKNYSTGSIYKYGDNLAIEHKECNFNRTAKPLIDFLLKYGQAFYYSNKTLQDKFGGARISSSSCELEGELVDDFFNILKNNSIEIDLEGKRTILKFTKKDEYVKFKLEEVGENQYKLSMNKATSQVLEGASMIYAIEDDIVYEYDRKEFKDTFNLVEQFDRMDREEYHFDEEQLKEFVSNVFPAVSDSVSVDGLSEKIKEDYIPKKLGTKVYLDVTKKGDVLASVKFCYGDIEFEPNSNKIPKVARNISEEKKVFDRLKNDGFSYSKNYESYIMKDEDKIYNFMTDAIEYYMAKYEVLISEEFKKREVRQPKISTLGVKIQNDLLNIDLSGLDFEPKELQEIMQKYKLKKKYYRLKNGEFLSLEQNADLDFIEDLTDSMNIDYSSLSKGRIKVPVNRSLYLNKLLNNMKNVEVVQDKEYKELISNTETGKIDEEITIPSELTATLRAYQKSGYKWLKVLDKYKFGGILADDMGLRKNVTSNSNYFRK